MIEDPAGHEIAEGGRKVGGSAVAGVAFDAAGHFGGPVDRGGAVAGGEFGLFRGKDGRDFEFPSLFFNFRKAVVGAEAFSD